MHGSGCLESHVTDGVAGIRGNLEKTLWTTRQQQ